MKVLLLVMTRPMPLPSAIVPLIIVMPAMFIAPVDAIVSNVPPPRFKLPVVKLMVPVPSLTMLNASARPKLPPMLRVEPVLIKKAPALVQSSPLGIVIVPPLSARMVPDALLVQLVALSCNDNVAPSVCISPLLVHESAFIVRVPTVLMMLPLFMTAVFVPLLVPMLP